MININEATVIVKNATAFKDFDELVNAGGEYRPSFMLSRPAGKAKYCIEQRAELEKLADLYDHYQEIRGDERRAYRY
tara:strand:+ start:214 stop:444 length:231 start_codon:yes stop_codon:yes gene_type:complete